MRDIITALVFRAKGSLFLTCFRFFTISVITYWKVSLGVVVIYGGLLSLIYERGCMDILICSDNFAPFINLVQLVELK